MRTLVDRLEPRTGKPIAWVIVTVLIVAFTLVLGFIVDHGVDAIPDGTKGQQPVRYHSTGNAAKFRDKVIVERATPRASVPVVLISPSVLLARFKAGQLRNSHGILLPYKVRAAAAAQTDTAAERSRTWWRKTLNTGACIENMAVVPYTWTCVTQRKWNDDAQYLWWKKTTKIKLTCGGAAIFGYFGGAWKGAFIGASSCAWTQAVALW